LTSNPVNDLLNPWDYSQFLRMPLEDRKIGVPSLSTRLSHDTWSLDAVWVPVFIPYRLPLSTERWSPLNQMVSRFNNLPVNFLTSDADIPSRNLASVAGGPASFENRRCRLERPTCFTRLRSAPVLKCHPAH
jgi:hypothetical protein